MPASKRHGLLTSAIETLFLIGNVHDTKSGSPPDRYWEVLGQYQKRFGAMRLMEVWEL